MNHIWESDKKEPRMMNSLNCWMNSCKLVIIDILIALTFSKIFRLKEVLKF